MLGELHSLQEALGNNPFSYLYKPIEAARTFWVLPPTSKSTTAVWVLLAGHLSDLLCFSLPFLKALVITMDPSEYSKINSWPQSQLIINLNFIPILIPLCYVTTCIHRFQGQAMGIFRPKGHYSVCHNLQASISTRSILFFHIDTQTYTIPTNKQKFFGFPCRNYEF